MIAILFMKSHSERLPNKNIKDFCGKPLFYWIINTLSTLPHIRKIVVNTDSKRIATLVRLYFPDVLIHSRPKYLRGDSIVANDLIEYELTQIYDDVHFLQTHVTNPLITTNTIYNAIEFYYRNLRKYDSLFTVTKHQGRFYDIDGKPINHKPDNIEQTQNMKSVYEDNSCLYLFSRQSFARNGRVGLKPKMYEINKIEAIDIDTEEDFKIAEWGNEYVLQRRKTPN